MQIRTSGVRLFCSIFLFFTKQSTNSISALAEELGVTADYLMDSLTGDKAKEAISDKELLSQFQQVAKLSNDRKAIVKELIEAFLLKTDLQQKLVH